MSQIQNIIRYETGEMSEEEIVDFFQDMITDGTVWKLQGHYGRTAQQLIEAGLCFDPPESGLRMTELVDTLRWVIERIESEADVVLEGGRPNWRRAAIECAEEAYGALSRLDSQNQFDAIAVIRGMPNGLLTPQAMADYLEFKKREIGHG